MDTPYNDHPLGELLLCASLGIRLTTRLSILLSAPLITTNIVDVTSSGSRSSQSPPPAKHPRRRRRACTTSSDSEGEVITGHVLASGRFKCSDPQCDGLRFGRQADFRRHHINVHALERKEYFCTVSGCDRSKRPSKKSKGRSFGARKDKMLEHVHTVHVKESKESKKRKKSSGTEIEEEEEDDDFEGVEPRSKILRQT